MSGRLYSISGRTWVYQCHCIHQGMIYVGVASDVERRLREHRSKDWWSEVAYVLSDLYPTRRQALEVERYYIQTVRPTYNVAGKPEEAPPFALIRRRDFVTDRDGSLLTTLYDEQDRAMS